MSDAPRNTWSKLSLPEELSQFIYLMAQKGGYTRETAYLYLFKVVRDSNPEQAQLLIDFLQLDYEKDGKPN